MKKILFISLLTLGALGSAHAQSEKAGEKVEKASSVTKSVNYVELDGEKVLTIETNENGKVSTEVFKGAEAEAKMKEIESAQAKANGTEAPQTKTTVRVKNTEGETVIITETDENGQTIKDEQKTKTKKK